MTRADQLAEGWLNGNLSAEEVREFLALLDQEPGLLPDIIRNWLEDPGLATWADPAREGILFQKIMERSREGEPRKTRLVRFTPGWRAAAAAVLILLAGSTWLLLHHPGAGKPRVASTTHPQDLPPGGNKATLTLGNGARINLDSAAIGTLAAQGKTQVQKLSSGEVAYNSPFKKSAEVFYNTLSTPRGGQYRIILPDGTKVWLDASSSITYPTAFTGRQRQVEITGEAYFEVADNKSMPFIVRKAASDETIQVLGTHFNVNAYDDEDAMRTTLLEGRIKVNRGNTGTILRPGQQAVSTKDGDQIKVIDDANINLVMAWKNGNFRFDRADIQTVMRQIARWYDVDVEYKGGAITRHFGGTISRNVNVSQVFQMLEMTGAVKFKIDGKKIIVTP